MGSVGVEIAVEALAWLRRPRSWTMKRLMKTRTTMSSMPMRATTAMMEARYLPSSYSSALVSLVLVVASVAVVVALGSNSRLIRPVSLMTFF